MVLKIAEAFRRLHREEKGFTLIELIIVLAIMGILVAIGIPVYNNVMIRAAQKAHDSNLRTIDSAVQQYYMGEGHYPDEIDDLLVEGNKYLDEKPAIPDYLKDIDPPKGLGEEDEYTIAVEGEEGTDKTPWAQPLGQWNNAYRGADNVEGEGG